MARRTIHDCVLNKIITIQNLIQKSDSSDAVIIATTTNNFKNKYKQNTTRDNTYTLSLGKSIGIVNNRSLLPHNQEDTDIEIDPVKNWARNNHHA